MLIHRMLFKTIRKVRPRFFATFCIILVVMLTVIYKTHTEKEPLTTSLEHVQAGKSMTYHEGDVDVRNGELQNVLRNVQPDSDDSEPFTYDSQQREQNGEKTEHTNHVSTSLFSTQPNSRLVAKTNHSKLHNFNGRTTYDVKPDSLDISSSQPSKPISKSENRNKPISKSERSDKPSLPRSNLPALPKTFATCKGCTKPNFPTIISPSDTCDTHNVRTNNFSISLLILIFSSPTNFHARASIRSTWGSPCTEPSSGIRCVFVLANSNATTNRLIQKESDAHRDVVMFDFVDSYRNLTYKTIMSFGWVVEHCMNAQHILKTDDDMYVNTVELPKRLREYPGSRFYGGYCPGSQKPQRHRRNKWYVSPEQFPANAYPPFCSGTGYVLSSDVVKMVYYQSHDVPYFPFEDVFVGLSIHSLRIRVYITAIKGFRFGVYRGKQLVYEPCKYKLLVLTQHVVGKGEQERFWRGMSNCTVSQMTDGKPDYGRVRVT